MSVIQSFPTSIQGFLMYLKSMEKGSGLSELFVVLWLFAVEGCLLSGVPLYNILSWELYSINNIQFLSTCSVRNGKEKT